jgi:hypothetical protein
MKSSPKVLKGTKCIEVAGRAHASMNYRTSIEDKSKLKFNAEFNSKYDDSAVKSPLTVVPDEKLITAMASRDVAPSNAGHLHDLASFSEASMVVQSRTPLGRETLSVSEKLKIWLVDISTWDIAFNVLSILPGCAKMIDGLTVSIPCTISSTLYVGFAAV